MLALALLHMRELPQNLADLSAWPWHASELQRCAQISHERRRKSFLGGRHLARQLLAKHFGGAAFDWVLLGAAGQPPTVEGMPDLCLSISHSREWLVCALADQPLGVDVEDLDMRRDMGMAQQVCSTPSCAQLAALPESERASRFTLEWTLKEAWLKRAGCGLDLALMRALQIQPTHRAAGNARVWQLPQGSWLSLVIDSAADCQFAPPDMITGNCSYWQISPDASVQSPD